MWCKIRWLSAGGFVSTLEKRVSAKLVKRPVACQTVLCCKTGGGDMADSSKITVPDHPSADFSINAIFLARTAQINTLTLSQMADQKASILIGATFVVFSLSVTKLTSADLTWSVLTLAATAFVSSLCAVIAILPSVQTAPKIDQGSNILFFGNFARMEEEEWKETLLAEFKSDEAVLRIMLRDVYQNGQVLYRRKYRFLTYAYRAFLSGLLVTMVVYLAESVFGLAPIAPIAP